MRMSMFTPPMVMVRGILTSMLVVVLMTMAAHYASAQPVIFATDTNRSEFWYDQNFISISGNSVSTLFIATSIKKKQRHVTTAGIIAIDCSNEKIGMIAELVPNKKTGALFMLPVKPEDVSMRDIRAGTVYKVLEQLICHIV